MDRVDHHSMAAELFSPDVPWLDVLFSPQETSTTASTQQLSDDITLPLMPAYSLTFSPQAEQTAVPTMANPFLPQAHHGKLLSMPGGLIPQAHPTRLPGISQAIMAQVQHETAESSTSFAIGQAFSCNDVPVPKAPSPKPAPMAANALNSETTSAGKDSNVRTEAFEAYISSRGDKSCRLPAQSDFLQFYHPGDASISFRNDAGSIQVVEGLNKTIIVKKCPLLAAVFEESRSGLQCHLELLTWETVWPFLRFIYTGSYALRDPSNNGTLDVYETVPTSMLLHCQLYQIGDVYDLKDLKTQAYVNVLRQCEFGCSSPFKPVDLCAAIRFTSASLPSHSKLTDAFVNYCVSCFLRHSLADDAGIKELIYEQQSFYLSLYQNALSRGSEFHETATAIVRMPFKRTTPEDMFGSSRNKAAAIFSKELVSAFKSTDAQDDFGKKRKCGGIASPTRDVAKTSLLSNAIKASHLPLRLRTTKPASPAKLFEGSGEVSENAQSNLTHKRRASADKDGSAPVALKVEESEYEIVSGVSSPKSEASEYTDGLVVVASPASHAEGVGRIFRDLPVRSRVAGEDSAASAEESDWSLI